MTHPTGINRFKVYTAFWPRFGCSQFLKEISSGNYIFGSPAIINNQKQHHSNQKTQKWLLFLVYCLLGYIHKLTLQLLTLNKYLLHQFSSCPGGRRSGQFINCLKWCFFNFNSCFFFIVRGCLLNRTSRQAITWQLPLLT